MTGHAYGHHLESEAECTGSRVDVQRLRPLKPGPGTYMDVIGTELTQYLSSENSPNRLFVVPSQGCLSYLKAQQ